MENKHNFIVQNINSNPIFNHPLILMRGFINNDSQGCNLNKIIAKVAGLNYERTYPVQQKDKDFQCLLELNYGENVVTLLCSCSSINISLKYEPEETAFTVLPVYIICDGSDGKFQCPQNESNSIQSACKRIIVACKILQLIIAELLQIAGYKRKTFTLNSDHCYIFYSKLHYMRARKMGQLELWQHFAHEIMNSSIGDPNIKYLTFLSCTYYDYSKFLLLNDVFKATEAYVAYGGGGLALLGTSCLYTWPEKVEQIFNRLNDLTNVDITKSMDNSCYRGTKAACFATSLGSALHELCHTFDLGHTQEGIMGQGFNNLQDFFLNGPTSDTLNTTNTDLEKYKTCKSKNDFFWTKNCSAILNYHKWLNSYKDSKQLLLFDCNLLLLKSLAGIRVVEIRTTGEEKVKKFWIFDKKVLKYQFQIPRESLEDKAFIVFCIDNLGNTLKQLEELKTCI